jgi:hypothetical protein
VLGYPGISAGVTARSTRAGPRSAVIVKGSPIGHATGMRCTSSTVPTGSGGRVPTAAMMVKQAGELQGLIVGNRRQQQGMVRALVATRLRPVIDRSFGLGTLADAFRHEESATHLGKICVEF